MIGSALSTIVEEMGRAIIRAAFSTNIKERQDCSTSLFNPQGRIVAQSEGIPIHLGSLLAIADYVLTPQDVKDVRPGDVFIGNDVHTGGCTHLNDLAAIIHHVVLRLRRCDGRRTFVFNTSIRTASLIKRSRNVSN